MASTLTAQERFIRRKWTIENLALIQREVEYHRNNEANEQLPGVHLYKLDEEVGECAYQTIDTVLSK